MSKPSMLSRLVAEFVGMFALVFIGAGAVAVSNLGGTDVLGVAMAHGLVIAVMVCAVGHVSGGHFNPAVTFGMLVTGLMGIKDTAMYWLAQLAGGIAGAWVLVQVTPETWVEEGEVNAAVPFVAETVSIGQAIAIEAILTFFLVWVIFAVAVDRRGSFAIVSGIPIGLVIVFGVLMAGPLTGAAINPARSFGPALALNEWADWWVYWIGPLLGGALAAIGYHLTIGTEEPDAEGFAVPADGDATT